MAIKVQRKTGCRFCRMLWCERLERRDDRDIMGFSQMAEEAPVEV